MYIVGGLIKILDNSILENSFVISINIESKTSNIFEIQSVTKKISIGILIINPNKIMIPIIKLIHIFENKKVSEIFLNRIILIGRIATCAELDTIIIDFIFSTHSFFLLF